MNQIPIGVAFIAGILSFLSPCVLPLVPGYISFLSGVSLGELKQGAEHRKALKKIILASVFFVAGFSVVFMCLGASASFIGKLMADHIKILTRVAGILVIILGLHLTGIMRVGLLDHEKRINQKRISPGFFGAFLLGFTFGFGWTPCIGPILAGILALAAVQQTLIKGVSLLGVYSLGLGIPFIITGFGIGVFMRLFQQYKRFIRVGEIIAGLLLIIIGVLIFSNNLDVLMGFVPSFFYQFAK